MRTYLAPPHLAGNPRVPWLERLRPPHPTGWVHMPCDPLLGHHDDHHDALLHWLVMHCHRQPEWFPVYWFPYKLSGHCLKKPVNFERRIWCIQWKLLKTEYIFSLEHVPENVVYYRRMKYECDQVTSNCICCQAIHLYILFPMAIDGNRWQDLLQHWWHSIRYSNILTTCHISQQTQNYG